MKRVIKDYNNITDEHAALIQAAYPNGFENETTPAAQASIVEIVAQQLSIYAVERDSEKNPDRYPDAPSIFFKQQEFIPRFIIALQSGLLDLQ